MIDYGLWSRDERSALRQVAADLGATIEMRYFELTPAEQRRRLDQRQADAPHTTWPMPDAELAEWAAGIDIPTPGELDGSEPIDGPPAGFATWDEWLSVAQPLLAAVGLLTPAPRNAAAPLIGQISVPCERDDSVMSKPDGR